MITPLPTLLKVLSDPTRLRILALLEFEELSVGELSRALGMLPSRVSNHLRILREHRLLRERHAGTSTYLRPGLDVAEARAEGHPDYLAELWSTMRGALGDLPEHASDRMRLQSVVAERSAAGDEFFDRVAGEWDKRGALFGSGQARQRAAANLLPAGMVFADLGCGTGYFARALDALCERLICVDSSAGMLEEAGRSLSALSSYGDGSAGERAPGNGMRAAQLELRQGLLDDLPIKDDEVDGALAGMVLHHLPDLGAPLREMFRVVRPGGTAVVIELAPHKESWMRAELGDLHLGLESSDVLSAFERAGFVDLRLEPLDDRYCPEPLQPTRGAQASPEQSALENGNSPPASAGAELPLYLVRGRVPSVMTRPSP